MGSHVPTVRQEGHGAEKGTGGDFNDHHGQGQGNHLPGASFVALLLVFNSTGIRIRVMAAYHRSIVLLHPWPRRGQGPPSETFQKFFQICDEFMCLGRGQGGRQVEGQFQMPLVVVFVVVSAFGG